MSIQLVEVLTEEVTAAERSSQEIVQENRDYTLFSWSVQGAAISDSFEAGGGRLLLGWRR